MTTIHEIDRNGTPSASTIVNPVRRGPILLALHGASSSPAAILTAQLIATRVGLDVDVVSVTAGDPALRSPLDIMPEPGSRTTDSEHHEGLIRSAIRQALVIEPAWPISVRHGQPAHEVAREAQAIGASMIIVNSAPSAGILRTMSGIFASEVARRSTCPVLAVASPLPTLPQRIVAAVDFSPASIRAVQAALMIADAHVELTLLHVPVPVGFAGPHLDHTGAPIGADVTSLFDRLEAEIRPYAPEGITVQRVVAEGSTSSAILESARSQSADLIAAGTHGPNRLERFFVGSTAVSLLHLSSSAVLIAPAPAAAERIRLELGMSDMSVSDDPKDWATLLGAIISRNRGRFVTLEVTGVLTAHVDHFILRDLAYDAVNRCIEIRVTDTGDGRCGFTRTIGHPKSIIVSRTPDGRERALEVMQDRGNTLILFLDDVTH